MVNTKNIFRDLRRKRLVFACEFINETIVCIDCTRYVHNWRENACVAQWRETWNFVDIKNHEAYSIKFLFNPFLTNEFSHHYQLGESTFIFRGVRSDDLFFISFFDEISLCKQNSPRWDAAFYCLPMSHKKDAKLI